MDSETETQLIIGGVIAIKTLVLLACVFKWQSMFGNLGYNLYAKRAFRAWLASVCLGLAALIVAVVVVVAVTA